MGHAANRTNQIATTVYIAAPDDSNGGPRVKGTRRVAETPLGPRRATVCNSTPQRSRSCRNDSGNVWYRLELSCQRYTLGIERGWQTFNVEMEG